MVWTASTSESLKEITNLSVGPVSRSWRTNSRQLFGKTCQRVPAEGMELNQLVELKDNLISLFFKFTRSDKKRKQRQSQPYLFARKKNKHRLLELFMMMFFTLLSGAKAAIGFCDNS
jgi:hypothetical protein